MFDQADPMDAICDDLTAEHLDLDRLVADLADSGWDVPTAAPGWAVRDQISHLWFFDQRAVLALTDEAAFRADAEHLLAPGGDDPSVAPGRAMSPADLLAGWRSDRTALVDLARTVDAQARIPWYGPAMGARSFITARLMETWAHGQDVVDALDLRRQPTGRLRHIAHIGVRARPYAYMINDRPLPPVGPYVELTAPSGEVWEWGEPANASAGGRITGTALDFCLLATQRRHLDDTSLTWTGDDAGEWLSFAQAFAGGPGEGRTPGQFAR